MDNVIEGTTLSAEGRAYARGLRWGIADALNGWHDVDAAREEAADETGGHAPTAAIIVDGYTDALPDDGDPEDDL